MSLVVVSRFFVNVLFDPFFLEIAEKRFGYGVIPAIARAAHTGLGMMEFADAAGVTAVLSALIRVNQRAARSSATYSLQNRIEHELPMDRCTGCVFRR